MQLLGGAGRALGGTGTYPAWVHIGGVIIWMGTQGEGAPKPVPECRGIRGAGPTAPRCSRLVPLSELPRERRLRRSAFDLASVTVAGAFPRSLTSKGWVPPARPVSVSLFPHALLAWLLRGFAGERLARGSPPAHVTGKPWEPPRRGAFPETPPQAGCGKAGTLHPENPVASQKESRRPS